MNNKLVIAALSFSMILGFTSCEDDELEPFVQENRLQGSWNLTEIGALNALNTIQYTAVDTQGCNFDNYTFDTEVNEMTVIDFEPTAIEVCTNTTISRTYVENNGNIEITYMNELNEEVNLTYDIIKIDSQIMEAVYTDPETGELVFVRFSKVVAEI